MPVRPPKNAWSTAKAVRPTAVDAISRVIENCRSHVSERSICVHFHAHPEPCASLDCRKSNGGNGRRDVNSLSSVVHATTHMTSCDLLRTACLGYVCASLEDCQSTPTLLSVEGMQQKRPFTQQTSPQYMGNPFSGLTHILVCSYDYSLAVLIGAFRFPVGPNDLTPGIPSEEYERRRRLLMETLPDNCIAVSVSAPIKFMSGSEYAPRSPRL